MIVSGFCEYLWRCSGYQYTAVAREDRNSSEAYGTRTGRRRDMSRDTSPDSRRYRDRGRDGRENNRRVVCLLQS
jgi:hypothetical protein